MTNTEWLQSEARKKMIDHLERGTPLPEVMIDAVIHIWFARVGKCMLTRSEILIQGQHAEDDRKELCRLAYRNIQRAMKEHAQRLGFGRHANTTTNDEGQTDVIRNRSGGITRERDRKDDRLGGFDFSDDHQNAARVSGVRDETQQPNAAERIISTRTGQRKRRADTRHNTRRRIQSADVHSTKTATLKVKRKRNTVTPTKRKQSR